jgi:hypothetical protein
VQPGIELVGITEPVELRDRDDEGVLHRIGGGFGPRQHRVAVGVEGRGVPVVRLADPIRVTCDDRRNHVTVLHALTVVGPSVKLGQNDTRRYQKEITG